MCAQVHAKQEDNIYTSLTAGWLAINWNVGLSIALFVEAHADAITETKQ
jgi:hypothetical protein